MTRPCCTLVAQSPQFIITLRHSYLFGGQHQLGSIYQCHSFTWRLLFVCPYSSLIQSDYFYLVVIMWTFVSRARKDLERYILELWESLILQILLYLFPSPPSNWFTDFPLYVVELIYVYIFIIFDISLIDLFKSSVCTAPYIQSVTHAMYIFTYKRIDILSV